MKKATCTLLLVIVLLGTALIGGCSTASPESTPQSGATAAAPASSEERTEILVGAVNALTGDTAGFGQGDVFGLEAAVEDINAQGGVMVKDLDKKLPIKLIVRDNESNPNKAGTLAEDLILREKVDFIARGLEPPHIGAPIATVAEKYGVPMICGVGPYEAWMSLRSEASPVWNHTWTASFAIATPAEEGDFRHGKPGYTMMDSWTGALGQIEKDSNKKVAAFASDDPDGRGWYLAFSPVLKEMGWEVYGVDEEFGIVPLETTDFTPLIKAWMDAGCDTLWANCPGPFFGTLWRQAHTMGFRPKMVYATRAALYYEDISAWGGDLPAYVSNEHFWDPAIQDAPGIGDTTPQSLNERWIEETGKPMHTMMATGYQCIQILIDAIERAGTLDKEKVNEALGQTDLKTIYGRVVFDKDNFSRLPVSFGQWVKTDKPWVWENPVVISQHDFLPATTDLVYPIPYE